MSDEEPDLLRLARSISDRAAVDWEKEEKRAVGDDEIRLIEDLRLLAKIVEAHRSAQGASWGSLEILERLGDGSFGDVYRARDTRLGRDVALKLLATDASGSVIEEGRLLARVRHPNVVTVHGAERHDGRAGIWMELISGCTLTALLGDRGRLGAAEAGSIGLDLCRALSAVHGAGLVHGDVKAHNVMREDGGRIVLMDFGAGRDIAISPEYPEGPTSGTPLYLAPELFAGEAPTVRSDLYSLGVLLFHLVTGSYPVQGKTLDELREAHARERVHRLGGLRPDLPASFVRVVERALATDPGARFTSAASMEAALAACLGIEATEASRSGAADAAPRDAAGRTARLPSPSPSQGPVAARRTRRLPLPVIGAACVIGAVLIGWLLLRFIRREAPTGGEGIARQATGTKGPERDAVLSGDRARDRPASGDASAAAALDVQDSYSIEAAFFRGSHAKQRLARGDRLRVGDPLSLELHSSRDVYLYVIDEDDEGEAVLLFPLPGESPSNHLAAGETHVLPGVRTGESDYWQVTSAGGEEHLLVVASPSPLTDLETEIAGLIRPEAGRPAGHVRLSEPTKARLRGIAGFVTRPAPTPGPARNRLFEGARSLETAPETARGVWVRRLDLENP